MTRLVAICAAGSLLASLSSARGVAGQVTVAGSQSSMALTPAPWGWPQQRDPIFTRAVEPETPLASSVNPQSAPQDAGQRTGGTSWKGIGKWVSLVVSTSSVAYGFGVNSDADRAFRELQDICDTDPDRCDVRATDGSFSDVDLEQRYQDVVRLDDRARAALIVGQLGIVATAVLFILDLGGEGPPDIPYVPPPALRVGADGVSLSASLSVGG